MSRDVTLPLVAHPLFATQPEAVIAKPEAKYSIVQKAFDADAFRTTGRRELPHIHQNHVDPRLVNKLRVNHMCFILSNRLADFIIKLGRSQSMFFQLMKFFIAILYFSLNNI